MFDRKTAKICQSENIFYICSRKTKRKGFEYQTEKRRSTRRKRKNYCFDLGKLKENGLKTTDR